MNLDTSSPANILLVVPLKKASSRLASALLRTAKRQSYQNSHAYCHVIIVLPSLLSYAYGDVEQYHADWNRAMAHHHAISRASSISSEIYFIHGSSRKLIRKYKRKHSEWALMNRTQAEENWIKARWFWRGIKRQMSFNPFKFFTHLDKLTPSALIWK